MAGAGAGKWQGKCTPPQPPTTTSWYLLLHGGELLLPKALGKGLEHSLACLRGCEEWTHVQLSSLVGEIHSLLRALAQYSLKNLWSSSVPVEPNVWVRHFVSLEAR